MLIEVKNASRGGINFYSDQPLEVEKRYTITLGPPHLDEPMALGLTVVRCVENTDVDSPLFRYEFGCRLDEPLPEDVIRRLAAGAVR